MFSELRMSKKDTTNSQDNPLGAYYTLKSYLLAVTVLVFYYDVSWFDSERIMYWFLLLFNTIFWSALQSSSEKYQIHLRTFKQNSLNLRRAVCCSYFLLLLQII